MSGACKHLEIVSPAMPKLDEPRLSVKFGQEKTKGSIYARSFYFDANEKKYRYFKSDNPGPELMSKKDIYKKAKNLAKCDYEINTKENPGEFAWKDRTGRSLTRLSMRFDERKKWPIFVYDEGREDLEILHGLKAYGVYCKKLAEGNNAESKADMLLNCLNYTRSAFALNTLIKLSNKVRERVEASKKLNEVIKILGDKGEELLEQRRQLLRSWAGAVLGRTRHYRPRSTIKLALFLRSMALIRDPTEKIVIESAQKIVKHYKEHRLKAKDAFDFEVTEKASRRLRGIPTLAHYKVSRQVTSALDEGLSKDVAGFDFPERPFKHNQCSAKLDYEEFEIVVKDDLDTGKIFGRMLIRDISSIVLDDPLEGSDERKKWLRVNGRRIIRNKVLGKLIINLRKRFIL
jgi:hypothetical protein